MKQRFRDLKPTCVFAAALAILLLLCTWALAEPQMDVQLGYDGVIFSGRAYPLCVQITADEAGFEGEMTVDIGVKTGYYDRLRLPVSLEPGEKADIRLPIMPMVEQRSFTVRLNGSASAEKTVRAASAVWEDAMIIGVVDDEAFLANTLSTIKVHDIHGVQEEIRGLWLDAQHFPKSAQELDAFDALVIAEEAALDETALALIDGWRRQGGTLLAGTKEQPVSAMTAQQVFDQIMRMREEEGGIERGYRNVFGESLAATMRLDEGNGVFGVSLALGAYAVMAGCGLYLLMKRRDRSKELWLAIPAAAAAMCALMAIAGHLLGVKEPAAVSVHVTHTDTADKTTEHELALVSAGEQDRLTIDAGVPLERMEYKSFRSWTQMDEAQMEMRDVITLGDAPSIELLGQAVWQRRALLLESSERPEGLVSARCWMEEDGLHAEAENRTDMDIQNAVLLTEMGFVRLGNLAAGETKKALIARTDAPRYDENGLLHIEEGILTDYQESLHRVINFCADPQGAGGADGGRRKRSDREDYEISLESARLALSSNVSKESRLDCILIADVPQIACRTLMLNGKAIGRTAQRSVLLHEIAFEPQAQSGYFYYPQMAFARRQAQIGANGLPVLGKKMENSYANSEEEAVFGFALSGIKGSVTALHLSRTVYPGNEEGVTLEVYDHLSGKWTALDGTDRVSLTGKAARQAISGSGEVFFRYRGERLDETGVRLPELAVEGRTEQTEGGGAL